MIRVSQIKLTNLLSFRKQTIIDDIAPISVFVGPNNSGKSNFWKSMKFYQSLSEYANVAESYSAQQVKEMQHRLMSYEGVDIEVMYHYTNENISKHPLVISHLISFDSNGKFKRETLWFKKSNIDDKLQIFIKEKEGVSYTAKVQNQESINAFLTDSPPTRSQSLEEHQQNDYKPFFWAPKINNSGLEIFEELRKLVKSWIFISGNKTRGEIEKYLYKQLGNNRTPTNNLLNLLFKLTETNDVNFDIDDDKMSTVVTDIPGVRVKLDYFGSGFEQIFILLPQIYEGFINNTIFFIEEPEVHLHPHFQRRLLQYFIQRTDHNQFFLTTHSTIFCRQQDKLLQPYLVTKKDYQTKIDIINKDRMEDIKSILGHVNTDLFGYNAVLFVEGGTEESAIPLLAKDIGIDTVDYGLRILNSKGYGNMRQVKYILELLKETGTEIYAVFDNHHVDQGRLNDILSKLDKNHILELQRAFEDCFSGFVLTEAFSKLCSKSNHSLTDEERARIMKELSSRTENAFEVFSRNYSKKTQGQLLSKVDFGEAIATTVNESDEMKNSKSEELLKLEGLLKLIQADIDRKLDIR